MDDFPFISGKHLKRNGLVHGVPARGNQRRLGRAEIANGGTLFLDEIGELPLHLQAKLLTFLQDKTFYRVGGEKEISSDIRVVAATNQDLEALTEEGRFREDLYFRLNVLPLEVPSLKERLSDISIFVDHFLHQASEGEAQKVPDVDPEVYEFLKSYTWPGNIRELHNVVMRAYTLRAQDDQMHLNDFQFGPLKEFGGDLGDHFGTNVEPANLAGRSLVEIEKEAIQQTLEMCSQNKSEAARILGIAEKSIYNKIKRYGI